MIDAGSTGSRIHVYRFNNCKATPELEHETFKMTEKKKGGSGLSTYGDDPEAAARSLDVLMAEAMQAVPDEFKGCSPVAVKATAGLRLLGEEKSNKILAAVRAHLEREFPFPVVSEANNGVAVMDGKDEGVYAWITLNYLLGAIGERAKTPTVAVFDLGGGSTQIVFEPTFKAPDRLAEGDHKYALTFGGRAFELYQHSHLGYGLMQARAQLHAAVVAAKKTAAAAAGLADLSWETSPLEHPCFPPGVATEPINVTLPDQSTHLVSMTGPTAGGGASGTTAAQCRGLAERILQKDAKCALAPCSFNGVHQPSLERTFAREDVYLFSYFYDRLQPLGMPASFTLRELRDVTARVCEGEAGWKAFEAVEGALPELRERPEYCMDLNFMLALLHTGYEMPMDREVRIAKKIKENELGWCLGARYVSSGVMREGQGLTHCGSLSLTLNAACHCSARTPGGPARSKRSGSNPPCTDKTFRHTLLKPNTAFYFPPSYAGALPPRSCLQHLPDLRPVVMTFDAHSSVKPASHRLCIPITRLISPRSSSLCCCLLLGPQV